MMHLDDSPLQGWMQHSMVLGNSIVIPVFVLWTFPGCIVIDLVEEIIRV